MARASRLGHRSRRIGHLAPIKRGDEWTDPAPLGAGINSDGYDLFPFVSPDGRDLFFVRDFATFHRVPLADALASIGLKDGAASRRSLR